MLDLVASLFNKQLDLTPSSFIYFAWLCEGHFFFPCQGAVWEPL